ncbi:TlpA family protein disulfide reductase [Pseudoalteromonas pernae]|uniref:TlpA family protein disulfide reductase n=1 Tax=Pseudoalteromonas pernae TaxID=3118054 RepID=UPI0032423F5E
MHTLIQTLMVIFTLTLAVPSWASEPFVGQLDSHTLLEKYDDFSKEYAKFETTDEDLVLMQKLQGKSIVVLFGTWCHDSHREVPRLLKLLAQAHVELAELKLVAVDYAKEDDNGIAKKFGLKYTPTFIVLDGDKEVARVIEKPEGTLASALSRFD